MLKKKINTFISIIKYYILLCRHFGVIQAFHIYLMQFIKGTGYKHEYILTWLKKHYSDILDKYKDMGQSVENCPPSIIWVCWFQGEKAMPKTVKYCYDSIVKYSNGATVELITMNNYRDFVNIPSHIIDKVSKGKITLTHFSDIIRSHLLAEHGGIWIDATLLLTSNLKLFSYPFYSLKFRNHNDDISFVSEYRWSAFFMAGVKGNVVHSFLKDMFNAYHKDNKILIDYFLVDYVIALAYNHIPAVKKMIDDVPYFDGDIYYMERNLSNKVDISELRAVLEKCNIFKIGYKGLLPEYSDASLYKYIFN